MVGRPSPESSEGDRCSATSGTSAGPSYNNKLPWLPYTSVLLPLLFMYCFLYLFLSHLAIKTQNKKQTRIRMHRIDTVSRPGHISRYDWPILGQLNRVIFIKYENNFLLMFLAEYSLYFRILNVASYWRPYAVSGLPFVFWKWTFIQTLDFLSEIPYKKYRWLSD